MNNGATKINFGQLGVGISGVKPAEIIIIGLLDFVVLLLLLTYLWPLYFKVDPEKNLRFYYPFTCNYWSDNAQEHEDNHEISHTLTQSLISRPGSEKLQD